jgi:hypothetical protein
LDLYEASHQYKDKVCDHCDSLETDSVFKGHYSKTGRINVRS